MKKQNSKLAELKKTSLGDPFSQSSTFLKFAQSESNLKHPYTHHLPEKSSTKNSRSKLNDLSKPFQHSGECEGDKNHHIIFRDKRQSKILLSKTSYSPDANLVFESKASNDTGKPEHNFFVKNTSKNKKSVPLSETEH